VTERHPLITASDLIEVGSLIDKPIDS